jgi:hypothetical protein
LFGGRRLVSGPIWSAGTVSKLAQSRHPIPLNSDHANGNNDGDGN